MMRWLGAASAIRTNFDAGANHVPAWLIFRDFSEALV
jgi:hypothetical protein